MAAPSDENKSLALYCDFENIALGVRDAKYQKFDIHHILERLLVKGSIVVKKAYCDWDRYKNFKASMHEAAFELIEIPHVRMSGKNSADIRMVVDALDLCYTKSHVDTFVIISGDSDFSPLVSKLRENAKTVIGVGVKNSTSDLLISSCDEFIYYDDLVRELERKKSPAKKKRASKKRAARSTRDDAKVVSIEQASGAAADEKGSETSSEAQPDTSALTGDEGAVKGGESTEPAPKGRRRAASRKKVVALPSDASPDAPPGAPSDAPSDALSDTSADDSAAPEPGADEPAAEEGVSTGDEKTGSTRAKAAARTRRGSRRGKAEGATDSGDTALSDAPDEAANDEKDATEDDVTPEERAQEGLDMVIETALALSSERGGADKLWGSMVKQTLKRRRPGFNESYYGYDSFRNMLEDAASRGYLALEHDDRSGGYIITSITA